MFCELFRDIECSVNPLLAYLNQTEVFSVKPCNRNITRTLRLANYMIRLADKGDSDREDTGCGVLYGILRDSGYKLKQLAEKERGAHKKKGAWEDSVDINN